MQHLTDSSNEHLLRFEACLKSTASFMLPAFDRQRERFGPQWDRQLDELLRVFAGADAQKLRQAVEGYVEFALDGMRLQKRFEKMRRYEDKSYSQAAAEVYHNEEYMFSSYLPGILLSHYLWPHHYRQLEFFKTAFVPRVLSRSVQEFCDIGVGTGFYSRQLLTVCATARGWACDISEPALRYSKRHLAAFGVADRWSPEIRDIVANPPSRTWNFLLSVEVLEHLTDPVLFLKAFRGMLSPGGFAFVSAAVTAANRDHIYLYNSADDVLAHLEEAGLKIVEWQRDTAYEPRGDQPVPINVAVIVTTS
jgi:2-polyprenyl-3-methyl-5-hydroxy-6-metoxy-1,4-benzoquinol methylase